MVLSYEKAASIAKKLIEKGELAGERQQKFITDLLEEAKKNTSEISKIISERMEYLAEKDDTLNHKGTTAYVSSSYAPQNRFSGAKASFCASDSEADGSYSGTGSPEQCSGSSGR